jgi:hypothetical protein
MKTKIFFVFLLFAILFFSGCASNTTTQTVPTEDGDVQVTTTTTGDKWCSPGTNWKAAGEEGTATWIIDKLEISGKYAGYCHVVYTSNMDGESVKMDYWFDESGENGYIEMDVNGQTFVQEFHN